VTESAHKGLDLPERIRQSLAAAVTERGIQARMISVGERESMRPPQGHLVIVGKMVEIDAVRGPSRIVRRLEFYRTHYGPVVRLAFSIYPGSGEPLNGATLLNVAQVSGDTALNGLGRQKTLYMHFYHTEGDSLTYAFSKKLTNAPEPRAEAKKVLKMARDAYTKTPEDRRSFRWAVGIAESRFELPVSE
jgi:hypothetical protein